MTQLLVRHQVANYDQWKSAYDNHKQARNDAGISEVSLWSNEDNQNDVYVLFDVADRNQAQAFIDSADLRETMQQAGVVSQPEFAFISKN